MKNALRILCATLAAIVLPTAALAEERTCVGEYIAKGGDGVSYPTMTFTSAAWQIDCAKRRGAPAPDCSNRQAEMENLLGVLDSAKSWLEGQGYTKFFINKINGRYFASLNRLDLETNSLLVTSAGFYDRAESNIYLSSGDVFCALKEPSQQEILLQMAGHEIFHSYFATTPVGYYYYQSSTRPSDARWLYEGMAEAIAAQFSESVTGEMTLYRDPYYNIPLPDTLDDGYDRSHFWYHLLRERGGSGGVGAFVVWLGAQNADFEMTAADQGIGWLESSLRKRRSSLHDTYGQIIGRYANDAAYYTHGLEGEALPVFAISGPTDAEGEQSDAIEVARLAASAINVQMNAALLTKSSEAEHPGSQLIDLDLDIYRDGAPSHAGLAVDEEWLDSASFRRTFIPLGKQVDLLARATNVRRDRPNQTVPIEVTFVAKARAINLSGPSCISKGSEGQIVVEYADGKGGTPPPLKLRAQQGSIEGLTFTSPPSAGKVKLEVQAYSDADNAQWIVFDEIDVRARACSVTMTIHDGGDKVSMVYDGDSDATRIEDASTLPSYFDASGIVALDEESGQWRRTPWTLYGTIGVSPFFFGSALPGMPQGTGDRHRAPLATVELVKKMRQDGLKVGMLKGPAKAPCPSGPGICSRYVFGEPSSDVVILYFNADDQPVAIGEPGTEDFTEFEYNDERVVVPSV